MNISVQKRCVYAKSRFSVSEPTSIDTRDWLLILTTSIVSIVGNLLLIPASRMATPTIVNMVRSTELLFAYAVQIIFFGKLPTPLVACGATFVLGSIFSMIFVDKIQSKLDNLLRRSKAASSTKCEPKLSEVTTK